MYSATHLPSGPSDELSSTARDGHLKAKSGGLDGECTLEPTSILESLRPLGGKEWGYDVVTICDIISR
jgi:hypothetical protein